jgi:putative SOS response-associated peptidase YedK
MCGRYAFFAPAEAVRRLFAVDAVPDLVPRYNIAPTQDVAIVREPARGARELALVRWGLVPAWAREASIGQRMINARAETVAVKPAYRDAFRSRRCLVLADGWYEWQPSGSGKQPWFIHGQDGETLGLAGLWERWRDRASGATLESCTIITRDAAPAIAGIHDRMPVVLPRAAYAEWLDPENADAAALSRCLAAPASGGLAAEAVSRTVNDARHEGAQLIEPLDPAGS